MTTYDNPDHSLEVLSRLDDWRHLPRFRLEERASPLFSLFLLDVLQECLPACMQRILIPEFPLSKRVIGESSDNRTYCVDYVAFSKRSTNAYFVELKTDMSYVGNSQKCRLVKASKKSFARHVRGIQTVCLRGNLTPASKRKYVHLFHMLAQLDTDCVKFDEDKKLLDQCASQGSMVGWSDEIGNLEIVEGRSPKIEIVYIQPCKQGSRDDNGISYIDFEDFAAVVQSRGTFGGKFAEYLRRWKKTQAGFAGPKDTLQCD